MNKMKPEIKAQWTAALRSGEYEQGKGSLNLDGRLCCLGVLCELFVKAHPESKMRSSTGDHYVCYGGQTTLPPFTVSDWAGMGSPNPSFKSDHPAVQKVLPLEPDGDPEVSLAGLNDRGLTFAEIADVVEKEF